MSTHNQFKQSTLAGLFEQLNLQLIDVGARGGLGTDMLPVAWCTSAIGFEPEPDECSRLNRLHSSPWKSVRYVSVALGGCNGESILHIPASGGGASMLLHNEKMLSLFGYTSLHRQGYQVTVETLTLDRAASQYQLSQPDYLKIDVEGAELDILKASPHILKECFALKIEVSFLEQRIQQPLMHEVLNFMLESGFILAEIRDVHNWRRRPLPAHPYSARWKVPYSRGVCAQCDLIFLRDPEAVNSDIALRRLVCVAAALGFFDYAVTAMRRSSCLEEELNLMVSGDFVTELGKVSRCMGRTAALSECRTRLRSIIPLIRSIFRGLPVRKSLLNDY